MPPKKMVITKYTPLYVIKKTNPDESEEYLLGESGVIVPEKVDSGNDKSVLLLIENASEAARRFIIYNGMVKKWLDEISKHFGLNSEGIIDFGDVPDVLKKKKILRKDTIGILHYNGDEGSHFC